MLQAPIFDGHSFDALSFGVDGFILAEVSVGGCHVAEAFVVALVVIVFDELLDLGFKIAGEEVVLEQNAVFESLMPALDFALGLRMVMRRRQGSGEALNRRMRHERASSLYA